MNDHELTPTARNFDPEKYRPYIAHLGLDRSRETEMIETLGLFLSGCVDRAFGHDPIQLAAGDRFELSRDERIPPMVSLEPTSEFHTQNLTRAFDDANDPGQRKQ